MENKEKRVEEMANIIENAFKVYFGANDLVEPEDFPYQAKDLAKELLRYYQPKLPEHSVVLSGKQCAEIVQDNYNIGYERGRKEMAEKIMQDLKPLLEGFVHTDTGENLYVYKCKQFVVEIKD